MSWYLKYRPKNVDELGLAKVRQQLKQILALPNLPHAFLLTGPRGLGKTSTARIIAQYINCLKPKGVGVPCGRCRSCRLIQQGQSVDVVEMDAASNRKIDDVRQLRSGVGLAPSKLKYKVYIIDEVHMLTTEAFNALLKTLEEPPSHVVFILATTELHKVPETIKSRCQLISYQQASLAELVANLERVAQAESVKVARPQLELIAKQARGSFRDSIKLLEQVAGAGRLDEAVLDQLLQADNLIDDLFNHLVDRDLENALEVVDRLSQHNISGEDLIYQLEAKLTQALTPNLLADPVRLGYLQKLAGGLLEISRDLQSPTPVWLSLKRLICQLAGEVNNQRSQAPTVPNKSKPQTPAPVKPPKNQAKPPTGSDNLKSGAKVSLDLSSPEWQATWQALITASVKVNHGLKNILQSARVDGLTNDRLTLSVGTLFHQQVLEKPKIREWIETFLTRQLKLNSRLGLLVKLDRRLSPKIDKTGPVSSSAQQKIKILVGE